MGYKNTPWSRTQYYRRLKKSQSLGVSIYDLPDGRGKNINRPSGSAHYKWNNALFSSQGYKKVRVGVTHPFADSNGYCYEHILVAALAYGAENIEDKIVHHINGDKSDNRIENLQIMTREEHNKHHNEHDKLRDEEGRIQSKKKAGRLLDGKLHDEYPEVRNAKM